MRRRTFMALLGGAAGFPQSICAQMIQAGRSAVVGWLVTGIPRDNERFSESLRGGLRDLGWIEGQNFRIEYRYAGGDLSQLSMLARELVGIRPDVIITNVTAAALAARKATSTIPIVAPQVIDPVGLGLVESYARPGGNVTGILASVEGLLGKQIELLREISPQTNRLGILMNPLNPQNPVQVREAQAILQSPLQIVTFQARAPDDITSLSKKLVQADLQGLLVLADPFLYVQRHRIAEIAAELHLPAMYSLREHVEAGGLLSYAINRNESFRRAAVYVDKILKGTKPGDLPVELPTRMELIVNLGTAKRIGLRVSEAFLLRADEVIE
jgi:putative ABC transport system substrate-binding protein